MHIDIRCQEVVMRGSVGSKAGSSPSAHALGLITMVGGALVGAYGLLNGYATLTSSQVVLQVIPKRFDGVVTTPWVPGGTLVAPYLVSVTDSSVSSVSRLMIQGGHLLSPLLWAAVMVALGWVLLRVERSTSVFDAPVFRSLRTLNALLMAVALVPTGLVLFGSTIAVRQLGWSATVHSDFASTWIPLLASYLGIAFRVALAHGARLADELDQVI